MKFVDTRWRGNTGLGRYSREICSRLDSSWEPAPFEGNPARPLSLAQSAALRFSRDDVVYSPGYAGSVTQARQILTIHDLIHRDGPGATPLKRAYYDLVLKPLVKRTGTVFTVSEASAREIRRWLHDDSVTIDVIINGLSPAFTATSASSAPPVIRPTVLYVGTSRAHKNIEVVFRTLRLLPDYELWIVSSNSQRIRALANRYGVESRVRIWSDVTDEELARLYRAANFTLVPSLMEGFGMPALESIACGTPVIHWAGCASVASTVGAAGIGVTSPHDEAEWAEALMDGLNSPRMFASGLSAFVAPSWNESVSTLHQGLARFDDVTAAA